MAPILSTRLSAVIRLALTSLALFKVATTSPLPSLHPLHDARSSNSDKKNAESTPKADAVDCPHGHYFSEVAMGCKTCSACPVNQIIRKPCTGLRDTVCGVFWEFDKFHQSPPAGSLPPAQSEGSRKGAGSQGSHPRPASEPEDSRPADSQDLVSLRKAEEQWRTLSFALIAVLSFICCLVVVAGFYVCAILRRSQNPKMIFRQPELLPRYPDVETEPRYVDMYFTSPDRFRPSHHLPDYEEIVNGYDVTEFPPVVTTSACDVRKDEVVSQVDEEERLSPYVNTEELDITDS